MGLINDSKLNELSNSFLKSGFLETFGGPPPPTRYSLDKCVISKGRERDVLETHVYVFMSFCFPVNVTN